MKQDNKTLFTDGFDDALMGVTFDQKAGIYRIVYDKFRMIEELMIRDGMSLDESAEYLEYNVWNVYVGKGTPLYVDVMPDRQDIEDYLLINE